MPKSISTRTKMFAYLVGALCAGVLSFQNCTHKTENNYYTLPESTASSAATPTPTPSGTPVVDTLNGEPITLTATQFQYESGAITALVTINGVSGTLTASSGSFVSQGVSGNLSVYVAGGVTGNFVYFSIIVFNPSVGPLAKQYNFKFDSMTSKVLVAQELDVTTSSYQSMTMIMSSL